MGIQGLQTFMRRNDCCERVRLSDIADAYRNKTGKEPVLLVDLSSCLPFFYTSNPVMRTVSGELKKFMETLETLINNCKELGVELKIFGDGKKPSYKYRNWVEKTGEKVEHLIQIYSGQETTCTLILWKEALFQIAMSYILGKDTCKFSRAIYEADTEIFKYLKTRDCFAVLTSDSDFIMVDNVHYCLTPDKSSVKSMSFFNFNRNNLAKLLSINASQFPLFASLCLLSDFQRLDLLKLDKQNKMEVENRFFGVANLIRKFTSKEELFQYISSLMKPLVASNLERRLKFYLGEEQEGMRHSGQNHWGDILNLAEERHKRGEADRRILSILQDKVKFISPICENILVSLSGSALLTIRKKIYGILFFEHPDSLVFVTEFSYGPKKEIILKPKMSTVVVERRPHPGLLKLWSLENAERLKTLRLTVFYETINEKLSAKDFSSLNIPEEYVFPILTAFYLLWECDEKVKQSEVKTILIQAVLVNRLTADQIDQLPEEFHPEALHLSGWFCGTLDCLQLLSSVCGEPFCRRKANVCNFFDGKVMHYVYGKMKKRENPWKYFKTYENEYRTYRTLTSALLQLGRTCGHIAPKDNRGSIPNGDRN